MGMLSRFRTRARSSLRVSDFLPRLPAWRWRRLTKVNPQPRDSVLEEFPPLKEVADRAPRDSTAYSTAPDVGKSDFSTSHTSDVAIEPDGQVKQAASEPTQQPAASLQTLACAPSQQSEQDTPLIFADFDSHFESLPPVAPRDSTQQDELHSLAASMCAGQFQSTSRYPSYGSHFWSFEEDAAKPEAPQLSQLPSLTELMRGRADDRDTYSQVSSRSTVSSLHREDSRDRTSQRSPRSSAFEEQQSRSPSYDSHFWSFEDDAAKPEAPQLSQLPSLTELMRGRADDRDAYSQVSSRSTVSSLHSEDSRDRTSQRSPREPSELYADQLCNTTTAWLFKQAAFRAPS
eukprot:g61063.t1